MAATVAHVFPPVSLHRSRLSDPGLPATDLANTPFRRRPSWPRSAAHLTVDPSALFQAVTNPFQSGAFLLALLDTAVRALELPPAAFPTP